MTDEPRSTAGALPDSETTDDLERLAELDTDWRVQLEADGRLLSPSPVVQQLLSDRLHQAELLPTSSEWTVFRSLGTPAPLPEAAPPREVVCCGVLGESAISLIDFMGFLATGYQTGVLTVASDEVQRSVYVHEGDVVWASSTAPDDRLGEFLLRRGKITREQLQTAMRRGQTRLGRACVECGFLAAHELWSMVQNQLTEIFDQILRTEHGIWTFSRISSEALAESRIHLSTQGLLMDALRRLDEMKVFRTKVRSSQALVRRATLPDGRSTDDLLANLREVDTQEAQSLLHQLPRSVTVQELMRYLGRGEFEVTRLVYHLLGAGLVELVNAEPAAVAPRRAEAVQLARARDVIDVYSMAMREMVQELDTTGRADALLETARAFLEDGNNRHAAVLAGVEFEPDGRIREAPLIADTARQGTSVQQLSDALSELLFFVLFQATDMLGYKRGDDLARRVKVILELLSRDGGE